MYVFYVMLCYKYISKIELYIERFGVISIMLYIQSTIDIHMIHRANNIVCEKSTIFASKMRKKKKTKTGNILVRMHINFLHPKFSNPESGIKCYIIEYIWDTHAYIWIKLVCWFSMHAHNTPPFVFVNSASPSPHSISIWLYSMACRHQTNFTNVVTLEINKMVVMVWW